MKITDVTDVASNRETWCKALESGEFKQGRGVLHHCDEVSGDDEYCCLGVATMLMPNSDDLFNSSDLSKWPSGSTYVSQTVSDAFGLTMDILRGCVNWNDCDRFNFAEIAVKIRELPLPKSETPV